jgi:hypothetical protein
MYAAPATTYAAPATAYVAQATTYSAPAVTYGAPSTTYTTQPAYGGFDAIDRNHDGVITQAEFLAATGGGSASIPLTTTAGYA